MFRAPLISTMASWAARASNLFGAVTKGKPVSLATAAATFVSKPTLELSPAKHKARVIIAAKLDVCVCLREDVYSSGEAYNLTMAPPLTPLLGTPILTFEHVRGFEYRRE